jgi:hypothetical protein
VLTRKSARVLPWIVRVVWLAMPFTVGWVAASALDDRSTSVQVTAAVLLWAAWAIVVVGLLVPRPAGLVLVRVGAVGCGLLTLWSADTAAEWLVGGGAAVVVVVVALRPETGEWLVNGSSYGYERRYLLRPPAPVVLGPMIVAAAVLPVAVVAGPLLVAARQWVVGVVAVVVGGVVAVVLARALHSMAVRWAVLVPAGLVLKDHVVLLDPVLFRRVDIASLGPAPADTDALDVTAGALGLALELRLRAEQELHRHRPVRRGAERYDVSKLLFTPTRPSALLADAASRHIRVEALA